jgi:hypothetical protein
MSDLIEYNFLNDDKLINLIKENFNTDDNELFTLSFKLYTNSQTNLINFIIDLDDVYKWIGFKQKIHAKNSCKKIINNSF